jgi:hypothetical protein
VVDELQVGMGSMDHYERDFEDVLLTDTAGYYKRKAAEWINEDSCPEYMLKVTGRGWPSVNQQLPWQGLAVCESAAPQHHSIQTRHHDHL